MKEALQTWLGMADRGDYKGIMLDTAERSYTGAYLERGRKLNKLIALAKPKDYTRFRILCESCLEHDARDELGKISCPVMVIGAAEDKVLGGEASKEIAAGIPDAELYMYEGYSHGVYEQAKDFNNRVLDYFLQHR